MREMFHRSVWVRWLLSTIYLGCSQSVPCDRATDIDTSDASVLREVPVIDHAGWSEYSAEEDPLPSHQPEQIVCGPAGWYVEPAFDVPLLEIDTNYCNYVLLEHPLIVDLAKGDRMSVEVRHYDLLAPEPASAHLAIWFGDSLEWETHVSIPSAAAVETAHWRMSRARKVGEVVRLHLHNHGQNTWLIAGLYVRSNAPARGHR